MHRRGLAGSNAGQIVPEADRHQDRVALGHAHASFAHTAEASLELIPARQQCRLVLSELSKRTLTDQIPFALDDDRPIGRIDGQNVDVEKPLPEALAARNDFKAEDLVEMFLDKLLDVTLVRKWHVCWERSRVERLDSLYHAKQFDDVDRNQGSELRVMIRAIRRALHL